MQTAQAILGWHFMHIHETPFSQSTVQIFKASDPWPILHLHPQLNMSTQGFHQESSYIVTQWPMDGTLNDIWRLLFDYKINTLIVLHENKTTRVGNFHHQVVLMSQHASREVHKTIGCVCAIILLVFYVKFAFFSMSKLLSIYQHTWLKINLYWLL